MLPFGNDDLRDFCQQAFSSLDGLVESENEDMLEVVLSDELATNFDNRSYLKFIFDRKLSTQFPDAEFISYGHPNLDMLINLASQKGLVTRWYINGLTTTTGYLFKKVANKVKFYDCKTKYLLDILERFSYCLFNFKISYLTDDKKEEIRAVVVDRFSSAVNNKLLDVLNTLSLETECKFRGMSEGEIRPLQEVYQAACDYIKNDIASTIEETKKDILKRLSKEIIRVENYYLENEEEINQKLNKEGLSNERRQRLKQKLKINELEKQRKILDLEEKYKLKVNIKLLNVALIYQPKIKCKLEIIGKGNRFYFNVFWNPIFKDIELPFCMKCKSGSYDMWFDTDFGLICPNCKTR
ncbi:MAG: hypothetical protein AB1422_10895 [bacterium]